jgi:putative transposase
MRPTAGLRSTGGNVSGPRRVSERRACGFRCPRTTVEVGQSLKGHDVVGAFNQIRGTRGVPKLLFCDNGSEFISQSMDLWAYHNRMQIDFSRPGKPTDNAYVESFNGTLRAECLDVHWFANLREARQALQQAM